MDRNFYALSLKSLEPGCHLPFSLYVRSGPRRFCLYLPAGAPLSPTRFHHLRRLREQVVYISRDERPSHVVYLKDLLEHVVQDPSLPVEQKTVIVYDTVKEIVRQALEQPMPETIRTCAEAARSQVELILTNPNSLRHVLNISSFDYYTYTHSVNVGFLLVGMLNRLQPHLDSASLAEFGLGAMLHDIGKTRLPKDLLNKPGKFTAAEFAQMQQHPQLGVDLVQESSPLSWHAASIILHHHEDLDGSGYPAGLEASKLPLASRLVRIIDVYDALTTNRHYKPAMPPLQAFLLIKDEFARKLDQELVQELIQLLGPSGRH